MKPLAEYETCAARRTTILAAFFVIFLESGAALLQRSANGKGLLFVHLAHAVLAGLVALLLRRFRTVNAGLSLAAFLAIALPLLPIYWLDQVRAVAAETFWQPVIGRKLILLGLALLTPYPLAMAAILLTIFMGECVLLWKHLELWKDPRWAAAGEPGVTLLYGAVAGLLLLQRWRSRRLELLLLKTQVEATAHRQLMQISLAVHDQVNTPLQSLVLGIELLKKRYPEEQPLLERVYRAIQKLVELSQKLHSAGETEQGLTRVRAVRELGAQLERIEVPD